MKTEFVQSSGAVVRQAPLGGSYEDPLGRDSASDLTILTTRRSLLRLALVAAETASRFAREHAVTDPMAWMVAPRRLFEGRSAIDACLDREECLRAILLHGLSMGLDGDPDELDALAADDPDQAEIDAVGEGRDDRGGTPRLWTSYLVVHDAGGAVQAFDAVIADDRGEAEARLRARHGVRFSDEMDIVEGFDPSLPLAEALVSPALANMLEQVAADPASPLAEGLSVSVLQRFAS